jgi:hypothetical protein
VDASTGIETMEGGMGAILTTKNKKWEISLNQLCI